MKFEVGDIVKRIDGKFDGMRKGDIGTVKEVYAGGIKIKEYNTYPDDKSKGKHDPENFILVSRKEENEI